MAQGKRKTHEEFVAEVKALVGDEYTVLGTYQKSNTEIEILHEVCGKTSPTTPNKILNGRRCPFCSKTAKKTTEKFKEEVFSLVKEEYEVVSGYVNSRSRIDMHHITCGEVYPVTPDNFLKGARCPICARGPKKTTEKFKEEVFKLVKEEYEVVSEYISGKSKIDMLHITCGEVYPVAPTDFLRGNRCPKCYKTAKKTTEKFKEEVFKLVKEEYEIIGEYTHSQSKIDMLHIACGWIYQTKPAYFLNGNRCPKCNESKGEREISQWLSSNLISFESQAPIRYERGKRPLKLDFLTKNVAIEYDGEFHYIPTRFTGGEEGLQAQQRRDRIKDKYCADNGIPLIRIPYWDYDKIDEILTERLLPLLEERASQRK